MSAFGAVQPPKTNILRKNPRTFILAGTALALAAAATGMLSGVIAGAAVLACGAYCLADDARYQKAQDAEWAKRVHYLEDL